MLVLTVMLRRGAPLNPAATAALAALAVGAMANVGACLSLPHANSAITLVWHGGVVLVLAAVAALTARLVFGWSAARSRSIVDACRSIGGDMPYLRSLRAGASLIDVRVGPCADLNGLATLAQTEFWGD